MNCEEVVQPSIREFDAIVAGEVDSYQRHGLLLYVHERGQPVGEHGLMREHAALSVREAEWLGTQ